MSKIIRLTVPILILSVFLFFRFFRLDQSFFFFNDMGRDMMVLEQWRVSGKPPLLGPQTSALPFNQSAIYFYLLYPAFLLTGGDPISPVYTLAVYYLIFFVVTLFLLRRDRRVSAIFLISFLLMSIHPQYITQGRFVWNPSFVTPPIILSIIAFYSLLQKYSHKMMLLFAFSLALAVCISYSIAPLLIAFFIFWLLFYRRHFFRFFIALFGSFFILHLPTIAFETRHRFALTTLLLTNSSPAQEGLLFTDRINRLSQFIIATPYQTLNIILLTMSILLAIYYVVHHFDNKKHLQFLTASLYLLLVTIGLITPVSTQSHYIFGFTSLLFLMIGSLKPLRSLVVVLGLAILYLSSQNLSNYFQPARRSVADLKNCFTRYCSAHQEPLFVSVQSSFHPFHNGPEHRFLLTRAGCKVKEIEKDRSVANTMAVVLDDDSYSADTKYYELDLFGPHQETDRLNCQSNLSIVTLSSAPKPKQF